MNELKATKGKWGTNGLYIMCEGRPIGQAYVSDPLHTIKNTKDLESETNAKLFAASKELFMWAMKRFESMKKVKEAGLLDASVLDEYKFLAQLGEGIYSENTTKVRCTCWRNERQKMCNGDCSVQ